MKNCNPIDSIYISLATPELQNSSFVEYEDYDMVRFVSSTTIFAYSFAVLSAFVVMSCIGKETKILKTVNVNILAFALGTLIGFSAIYKNAFIEKKPPNDDCFVRYVVPASTGLIISLIFFIISLVPVMHTISINTILSIASGFGIITTFTSINDTGNHYIGLNIISYAVWAGVSIILFLFSFCLRKDIYSSVHFCIQVSYASTLFANQMKGSAFENNSFFSDGIRPAIFIPIFFGLLFVCYKSSKTKLEIESNRLRSRGPYRI